MEDIGNNYYISTYEEREESRSSASNIDTNGYTDENSFDLKGSISDKMKQTWIPLKRYGRKRYRRCSKECFILRFQRGFQYI